MLRYWLSTALILILSQCTLWSPAKTCSLNLSTRQLGKFSMMHNITPGHSCEAINLKNSDSKSSESSDLNHSMTRTSHLYTLAKSLSEKMKFGVPAKCVSRGASSTLPVDLVLQKLLHGLLLCNIQWRFSLAVYYTDVCTLTDKIPAKTWQRQQVRLVESFRDPNWTDNCLFGISQRKKSRNNKEEMEWGLILWGSLHRNLKSSSGDLHLNQNSVKWSFTSVTG